MSLNFVPRHSRGFTLVELLIVLAIISMLAAVIFPAFASVRRNGRRTDAISNLRQCALALRMYSDDYGGEQAMPSYAVAKQLLAQVHAPTYDLNDYWRKDRNEDWGAPLIGSFAYVRGTHRYADPEEWREYLEWATNAKAKGPTLLTSVFYSKDYITPLHGEPNPDQILNTSTCGYRAIKCRQPFEVVRARLDGSVAVTHRESAEPSMREIFSWEGVFFHAE